jgi:hypothetical protein
VSTADALELVAERDRALTVALEAERDRGWPAPPDSRAQRARQVVTVVGHRLYGCDLCSPVYPQG